MNILVVCHYGLYQDPNTSFVHNQAREYAAMGHRVRALIPIGFGKKDRSGNRISKMLKATNVDGVDVYDLRYLTLSSYGERCFNTASAIAAIRLHFRAIFRDFVPDVIHAHTLGFDSDIGGWLKAQWRCPLVITSHGGDAMRLLERQRQDDMCTTCDRADAVIAVSDQLRDKIRTCGTTTEVQTIHNGFVLRKTSGRVKDPYGMIQVGHLIPSKRTDVTIRAFAKLKKEYPQMHLTIIGAGYQRKMLEDLATQLQVADAVRFWGQIPNEDVFAAMEEATFFVMVSKPEGFGIVYLEAMAAGCVALGTQGQGIADVIRNGENGFLLPADDPDAIAQTIAQCLRDPAATAVMAEQAQSLAGQMTWTVNAQKYTKLFESLLKSEKECL